MLGSEELLGAVTRQVLYRVGELASAVVSLAGVTLCVLVREDRTCRFQHGARDEILARDHLEPLVLTDNLIANLRRNLRIGCGKGSSQINRHIYVRLYDAARNALPQRSNYLSHPRESLRGLSGIDAFVLRGHSSLGTATGSFKYFGPRVLL